MAAAIDLAGRGALVAGAAGTLGLACARAFLDAGAAVAVSDVDAGRLESAVAALGGGERVHAIAADVTSARDCGALAAGARAALGSLDHFACCAGAARIRPFAALADDEWRRAIELNLTGTFLATQAVGREMAAAGRGSIVLLSSSAAHGGRPLLADYAAAKAGVISVAKSAAAALAPAVRVNAICPGYFESRIWDDLRADVAALSGADAGREFVEASATRCLLGRPGEPAELAAAVLFLCSDMASYVTGQVLDVDGGLTL